MADSISAVENDSGRFTLGIQAQDSLGLEEDAWGLEPLEEELSCLFSISERIQWSLSQEDWMLFWRDFQEVKNMSPEELHIW